MSKIKHVIVIFIISTLFVLVLYLFPQRNQIWEDFVFWGGNSYSSEPDSLVDTRPYLEKLKESLPLVKESYLTKQNKHLWTLAKGKTLTVYLLEIQKHILAHHGKVLAMEEFLKFKNTRAVNVSFLDSLGDTTFVELQISESIFLENNSDLALAFTADQLDSNVVNMLNELQQPFSLLITPFDKDSVFFDLLKQIEKAETVLWLYMESDSLRNSHASKNPIRIRNSAAKNEDIIETAHKMLPEVKGVATRYGNKAVEHRSLLNFIFRVLEKQRLWFLDITNNSASLSLELCKNHSISCKQQSTYNQATSSVDDYLNRNVRKAYRTGEAYVILPLNKENLLKIQGMIENAKSQGTKITTLSSLLNVSI